MISNTLIPLVCAVTSQKRTTKFRNNCTCSSSFFLFNLFACFLVLQNLPSILFVIVFNFIKKICRYINFQNRYNSVYRYIIIWGTYKYMIFCYQHFSKILSNDILKFIFTSSYIKYIHFLKKCSCNYTKLSSFIFCYLHE